MKNIKANYFIVGSFVLVVLVGVVVAVAMLTGRTGATDDYYAVYDNVTGIEFGTRVLYEGYPVGQVEQISPTRVDSRLRFRVDMSIVEGWKIPQDSVAEIASSGLLAAVSINIRSGIETQTVQPGNQIPSAESGNVLAAMSDLAKDISKLAETDIKPLLANISRTVGGFGDLLDAKGAALIEDFRLVMADVSERMPEIVDNINAFSKKLNDSATKVSKVLDEDNLEAIDKILADLQLGAGNVAKLSVELDRTRASLDQLLGNFGTIISDNRLDVDRSIIDLRHTVETVARHINAINQNLEGTSRNMYEFSRQLRQNPGLLLGGKPPVDRAVKK